MPTRDSRDAQGEGPTARDAGGRRSSQNRFKRHPTPSKTVCRLSAPSPAGVARLTCLLAPTSDPEALTRLRRAIMVSDQIDTSTAIANDPDQEIHRSGKTA